MPKADRPKSIRDLYPHLTPEALAEAERNLDAYADLLLRILQRIESDPEAYEAMCRIEAPSVEADPKD